MKIAMAQMQSISGNVAANLELHVRIINMAHDFGVKVLVFPELSLTGYEPKLAAKLATTSPFKKYQELQKLSDKYKMTVMAGAPVKENGKLMIGMLIFRPGESVEVYCKQHLHVDELPFFQPGNKKVWPKIEELIFAPAICYESTLETHIEEAHRAGAKFYLASVAKSADSLKRSLKIYSDLAKKYEMIILMSNGLGPSDDFVCVGQSAVWNRKGKLLDQMDEVNPGILIFDPKNEHTQVENLEIEESLLYFP